MPNVTSPNMGLMFDKPEINIPSQALRDGKNFRCRNGSLESINLGWQKFSTNWTLGSKAVLIDNFFPRNLPAKLIFGTPTDLYLYNAAGDTISYLTPAYVTGTASTSGTAVTGIGTLWLANAKAGDKIYFGSASQTSTSVTWYTIQTVNNDLSITLTTSAGVIGAGLYTLRKLFTSQAVSTWVTDTFLNDGATSTDLWFATNGIEAPVTWNGTDTFSKLHPELGFTCKTLKTYSNMMIYGNVTQGGALLFSTIINSDVGLPLHAGATSTGLSAQFVAHSHADPILRMMTLGDYMIIYCQRIIVPIQFVGSPIIFAFRVAVSGYGPIGAKALADFGDSHEFLGADAGYTFDGASLKEANPHVWREVLRQADPIRRPEAYSHMDEETGDLIWVVPGNTDAGVGVRGSTPEIGWVEHYLERVIRSVYNTAFQGQPFSKRDFKFTTTGFYQRSSALTWAQATSQWAQFNFAWNDQFFQSAFPLNLAGDTVGQIWILNQTQTANGLPLPSFVRTGRFPVLSGSNNDLLTRIYPFVHASDGYLLEVTLFTGEFVGGEPTNRGTQSFNMSLIEGLHFVSFYRRGRLAEFQFGSSVGSPWILDGWNWDSVKGGRR